MRAREKKQKTAVGRRPSRVHGLEGETKHKQRLNKALVGASVVNHVHAGY